MGCRRQSRTERYVDETVGAHERQDRSFVGGISKNPDDRCQTGVACCDRCLEREGSGCDVSTAGLEELDQAHTDFRGRHALTCERITNT